MLRHSLLALSLFWATATAALAQNASRATDQVRWKLFFDQMFALELKKELIGKPNADQQWMSQLKRYTAYSDQTFNENIQKVLAATTSEEAYYARLAIFDNPESYKTISQLNFDASVPGAVQSIPAVSGYLQGIKAQSQRAVEADENFFKSPEAANFMEAISYSARKVHGQEVAFLLIPGYAAHAIKFGIFPETVGDMNAYMGRPLTRPILEESGNGLDVTYENYKDYYSRSDTAGRAFDILSPAGWEMGNTVGYNRETADKMAEWIKNLPPAYQKKKFILLGYSKGAPILMEMMQRHPELKDRVIGVVTYGGVIQGTHVARDGKKMIDSVLGARTVGDVVERVRDKGFERSIESIAPFLSPFDLSFLQIPRIKQILDIYGFDSKDLQKQADRIIDGRELRELLEGADDLHPMTRSAWNLRYFNDDLFAPGTFVFNLSAIFDISQFASRPAWSNQKVRESNLLTPKLKDNGKIDWPNFSLDAWFLYLSSLGGFKTAPGGLYDSQVDLQHTKVAALDTSPFSASLTPEEMKSLWNEPDIRQILQTAGVNSLEQFISTPRNQIFAKISNVRSYDLGEFKGHHWSLFHQAFRVPADVSHDYAVWEFPRKAFMRALLQTVALYNVIQQNS